MKVGLNRSRLSGFARLSAAAVAALYGASGAHARTLTYDSSGNSGPNPVDGSGNWDTTTTNWVDQATGRNTTFNTSIPDSAVFGSNPATVGTAANPFLVALTQNITVQDITFANTSGGSYYNIADQGDNGQTLTLAGNITKTAGVGTPQFQLANSLVLTAGVHVISANDTSGDAAAELTMNNGLTGAGSVTINNGNFSQFGTTQFALDSDYSGGTNIVKGRLEILSGSGLGTGAVTIGTQGNLSIGGSGSAATGNLNIANAVTITRNTYTGTDFNDYPDAITAVNLGGAKTYTFSGPFTVDSTDARVAANSNTITISSNIQQGADVSAGVLTLDGDFAGFVNLTGNNTALKGGIALIGGVELNVTNENSLGGPAAPLNLSGGTIHPTGALATSAFMNDFGAHVINNGTSATALGTLNTGLDLDAGTTFNASSLFGVALGDRGTGTLNFNGTNVFSGSPFFDAGIVNVTGNSSFGAINLRSSVLNVAAGATFNATNGSVTSFVGTNSPDNGTLNLNGTATFAGPLHIGGTAGSRGQLNVTTGSSLTVNFGGGGAVDFGDGSTGSGNISGGTINVAGETWIGNGIGGVGTATISGGTYTANNWFVVGRAGALGTLNFTGGTITKQGNGNAYVGETTTAVTSTMAIRNNAAFVDNAGEFWVGQGGGVGILTVADTGSLTVNSYLAVGRQGGTGTVNLSGGSITQQSANYLTIGSGGTGTVNVTGGTLSGLTPYIGEVGSGSGTLNVNGGTVVLNGTTTFGNADSVAGTLNLNGGTVTAAQFVHGNSTGAQTFNFNGGSLIASGNSAAYLSGLTAANVMAGGANFNTSTFAITVAQPLLGSTSSTGGGLTKSGTGTLTLAGANTYTGRTTVAGGTIVSANVAAIPAGTPLTVAASSGVNFNGQYVEPKSSSTAGLTLASLTAGGGDTFGFNASSGGSIDDIAFTAASSVTGTNTINLALAGGTALTPGTYNLFTDAAGGLGTAFTFTVNGTTMSSVTTNGALFPLTFSSTDTADTLTVGAGQIAKLFYTGNAGTDLNTAGNYSTDAAGTNAATAAPTSITDLVFTATANVANATPTANGSVAANSLEFNSSTAVTVGGTGTITLAAGANTFTAGTGIVVDAGAAADTVAANLALPTSQQFVNNSANPLTISGAISSTNAGTTLTYNGSGGFVASGANTYTGSTTVNGPALQLSNGSALGAATNSLTVAAGSVDLFGQQVTQSSLNLSGGQLVGSQGTGTLALTSTGAAVAFPTGGTAYNSSTAAVSGRLNLTGATNFIAKGTGNGNAVISGPITLGGNTTVALADTGGDFAAELALSGVISGTGSLTQANNATVAGVTFANQSDYGTLLVSNANTYSGGTNVNFGRLVISNGNALGTGPITVAQTSASGGTLQLGNSGDSSALSYNTSIAVGRIGTGITVPNALTLAGAVAGDYGAGLINNQGANTFTGPVTLSASLARIQVDGGSLTISGAINQASGVTATLGKRGGSTLVLSGANSYTGQTIITAGTLSVADIENGGVASNIGASPTVATGAVPNLLLNGGTLQYTGTASTTNRGYQLQANSVIDTGTGNLTFGGQILATGGTFTKIGAGTLTYTNATGTNNYETATGALAYAVNNGTVNFGATGTTASGQVNTFSGEVDVGATGQAGPAVVNFNSGTTTVNSYVAVARGNSTTGQTGTVNLNNDAVVTIQNFSGGFSNGLANYNGVGVVNLNGTSTLNDSGVFRVGESNGSSISINTAAGTTLNVSGGQLQVGFGGTGTFNQNGGTVVTTQAVLIGNTATTGVGTYTLGNGTAGSGVLRTTGVTGGSGTSTLTFNGGTLQATAASTTFVSGLTHAYVGAGPAVVDTNSFAVTVPQVIATSPAAGTDGGLNKIGTGTLTLTGTNTYAGGTTITAGTLATGTTGTLGLGNVTLGTTASAGTLTLANATSVADSAVVSFTNSSTFNLNAAGGTSETVASLFDLTTNTAFATAGTYTAAQLDAQFGDSVFASANGETMTIVGAPEPASLLLLGVAAAPLVLGRRRRQVQSV